MEKETVLKRGDTIAVIAPSESLKKISSIKKLAEERFLHEFGIKIKYGKNGAKTDLLGSSSILSRIDDLHEAFKNPKIKAIICATGGYNANDLLPHIDWEVIRQNPKPFIGSSDITVLLNAIYAKTSITTYFSPNFYKFGMKLGFDYTIEYFKKCMMSSESYIIEKTKSWSNDKWYKNQDKRVFNNNTGYIVCQEGEAKGTIIGGNLSSLNLLQGTECMPSFDGVVLFLEDDDLAGEFTFGEFNRNLQSLLQLPSAKNIMGIVLGRFPVESMMTEEKIRWLFDSKPVLRHIPIVANVDFGHTDPSCIFPIGGKAKIKIYQKNTTIEISRH